jgi:sugar (pentulose or hexulose) kinase
VLRFQETAALGAALMAGVGAGVYESEAAAVAAAVGARAVDRVEPDPSRAGTYDRLYRTYREAYTRTRGLMHDLAGCPVQQG